MKKAILIALLLCTAPTLFAQLPKHLLTETERVDNYDDYDGSIYMKFKYKNSSIVDEKVGTFDAKLKYNIYKDALEYTKGSQLYEVTKSQTVHARIDGDYFYFCDFSSPRGLDRRGYYVLVELNDRYRIYKKFSLEIKEPNVQAVTSGTNTNGELKTITTYFLEENGVVIELPMHKKDILTVFNDKEGEIKEYLKKAKIRIRKEEDLIRLVARYNAIKSSDADPGLLSHLK